MAVRFRETRARFRERPRFLGLDTSPVPIVAAAILGVFLLTFSYSLNPAMSVLARISLAGAPLILTFAYVWIFRTGRRPNLDRDLFLCLMNGKTVSPLPPELQPVHPGVRRQAVRRQPKRVLNTRQNTGRL